MLKKSASYIAGFTDACAKAGINSEYAAEMLKQASPAGTVLKIWSKLVSKHPALGLAASPFAFGGAALGTLGSWTKPIFRGAWNVAKSTPKLYEKVPGSYSAIKRWGKFTGKHPVLGLTSTIVPNCISYKCYSR